MTGPPPAATALRTLRFGHSPDADDAFMFYGFHTGAATIEGCRVEHVLEDIQSLNRRALERADLDDRGLGARLRVPLRPLRGARVRRVDGSRLRPGGGGARARSLVVA